MLKKILPISLFLLIGVAVSGCGIIDTFYLPPAEDTAQELFESGNDAMRDKDYVLAAELYTKLKDQYPFSPYTIEAELSLGDAYYLDDEFLSAVEAYKDFESMHPRHEAIPYVLIQIAQANMKFYSSVDKAPVPLIEAQAYLNRVLDAYSDSEFAEQATILLEEARKRHAEHEIYIGDFFWNSGQYGAAWSRYAYVVQNFPDTGDTFEYAKERGKIAYVKHMETLSKEERKKQEGSWKKIFNWL